MSKKLLVFDVEGTLFKTKIKLPGTQLNSTIWQSIAHALGPDAVSEEVATHHKWLDNQYDSYIDWMKDTIRIHRKYGLTRHVFEEIIATAEYNDGVSKTLASIDRDMFEPVLVTGGFAELAFRVNRDFGFTHTFAACSYLFSPEDRLAAFNLLPCDFEGKIDFIKLMLREHKLGKEDWIFVGDGMNDAPIAKEAPLSIGFRPHPKLEKVADYSIKRFEDMLPIIYGSSPK